MVAELKSLKELVLAHLHKEEIKLSEEEQKKVSDCLVNNKFYFDDSDSGYVLSENKIATWDILRGESSDHGREAIEFIQNGKRHRENDLPSLTVFYKDGTIAFKSWEKHGLLHRNNDLPAQRIYYKTGSIRHELWCLNDKMYRRDKPAEIIYYRNGQEKIRRYYWAGQNVSHNGLPAKITYYKNGEVKNITHKYLPTLPDYEPEEADPEDKSCNEDTDPDTDVEQANNEGERRDDNWENHAPPIDWGNYAPPMDWRDNVDFGSDEMFGQTSDPDSDGAFWGFEDY